MKNLISTLFFIPTFLFSQSYNITDQVCIGGDNNDNVNSTIHLSDGNILIYGNSKSGISGVKTEANNGDFDIWLVCMNSNLDIIWQKTIGSTLFDGIMQIIETNDNKLVLVCYSNSPNQGMKTAPNIGGFDMWIIKMDIEGNLIWDKTFGGVDNDYAKSIVETPDNSYIIVGTSASDVGGNKTSPNLGDRDGFIIKIDENGNLLWDKSIGGTLLDDIVDIKKSQNDYILLANSNSDQSQFKSENSYGLNDCWVVMIDENGDIINDKTIGGSNSDYANSFYIDVNQDIYVVSSSQSDQSGLKSENSFGGSDNWVFKLDLQFNLKFDKTIGSNKSDEPSKIININNNYLILGKSDSDVNQYKSEPKRDYFGDFWLYEITSDLSFVGDKTFGGPGQTGLFGSGLSGFHQISNGEYLLIGTSGSALGNDKTCSGYGSYDFWVLKVQSDLAVEQLETNNELQLFPNPVTNVLHVASMKKEINTLAVFDALGKVIYTSTSSLSQQDINLSTTESGFYYLQVTFEDGTSISKKFVKE
jgi:hypothetical protein